jgi:hypothetical protein
MGTPAWAGNKKENKTKELNGKSRKSPLPSVT